MGHPREKLAPDQNRCEQVRCGDAAVLSVPSGLQVIY